MKNFGRMLSKYKLYMPPNCSLLRVGAEAISILRPLVLNMAKPSSKIPNLPLANSIGNIDVEKREILDRANWLCGKIIVSPKELRYSYPSILGDYYGPQWSIYSCMMLNTALANIARIWPDCKSNFLPKMEMLITLILSDELKEYDAREWGEDPLDTLNGTKSHMTYLSILAWSLSNYRFAGGDNRYDRLFCDICETLNRRMLRQRDLNLMSFPNKPVFLPDMLVAIVALHKFGLLFDSRYQTTIDRWIALCRNNWLNNRTGIIVAKLYGRRKSGIRGCYVALANYWLCQIDEAFGRDQYERMKKYLCKSGKLTGIKEYLNKEPKFAFDPDAGPIVDGLSPSGTSFAIGPATYFGDWEFRSEMLRTALRAGGDVYKDGTRHYKLGEFAIVGEATVLAMRTTLYNL